MIILTSTTDKIRVSLKNAITTSQMSCYVSYRETGSSSVDPFRRVVLTNGTNSIDLVESPASSYQRVVDYISIFNTDTSSNEVIVSFFDGTNSYRLSVVQLAPGEKLEYQEGKGFKVISNALSVKHSNLNNSILNTSNPGIFVLSDDVISAGAVANTPLDIFNLKVPVKAGKTYWFKFYIFYDANATTTGSRWNIYGAPGNVYHYLLVPSGSTTQSFVVPIVYNGATAPIGNSPSTSGNLTIIEGMLECFRDGFIMPNFASELATPNDITVKLNSFVIYQQVA